MDYEQTSKHEDLERIVSNASAKPAKLSYSLVESITNNFSEDREIGRGGFGIVYKGVLRNVKVAVKKLFVTKDLSDTLFMDEINCLMRLEHRNIVRFLGYCSDTQGKVVEVNGRYVVADERQRLLCFEYVPNGNLHDYIKDVPHGDDWQIRYQIIKGICQGLCYTHSRSITHLDIKPENVMLDANMDPKITDFGLSRCMDSGKSTVISENKPGTLGFTAPEIIDKGEISFKSDVYSFGIIIVKLLIGSNDNNYDIDKWYTTLDNKDCPQVKRCVEIARECIDADQRKRPKMVDILERLNVPGSSTYQISSSDSKELIEVVPLDLCFQFGTKEVSSSVNLVNFADDYVAFMMTVLCSTTNCTFEKKGIIPPRGTYVVNVKRKVQVSVECNDRYQVRSTVVTESFNINDITADMFRKIAGRRIHEVELGVILSAPPQPRSLEVVGALTEVRPRSQEPDFGIGWWFRKLVEKQQPDVGSVVISDSTVPLGLSYRRQPNYSKGRWNNNYIECQLYLTNNTDEHVAFRIKNEDYHRCWIKLPLYGVMPPRSSHTLLMQRNDDAREPWKRLSGKIILQNSRYNGMHNWIGDDHVEAFKDSRECEQHFILAKQLGEIQEVRQDVLKVAKTMSKDILDGIKTISALNIYGHTEYIEANPTKPWMVRTGHPKGTIKVLNYETQGIGSLRVTTEEVYSPKFIARKKWIIVSSVDGFIHVCNYENKLAKIKVFRAGTSRVTSLAVHPTEPYVLSSSPGERLLLWDWDKDWECVQKFEKEHTTKVCQVVINPKDANYFATASEDRTVKYWSLHSPKSTHTLLGHSDIVNCLDFFSSGGKQYLITGSNDQSAKIWDMQNMICVQTLETFISPVISVLPHPSLPVLIVGTEAGTVHFWSSTDFRIERILNICSAGMVLSLACSMGSRRVLIGQEKLISILDINNEEAIGSKGNNADMAEEQKEEASSSIDVLIQQ